jgi:hypothetical protein
VLHRSNTGRDVEASLLIPNMLILTGAVCDNCPHVEHSLPEVVFSVLQNKTKSWGFISMPTCILDLCNLWR